MLPRDSALPRPSARAAGHSLKLVERLAAEIAASGGWVSFARYMEQALYAPGLGYYAAGATKLGAAGDFLTAPELSSLFSATLARQVAEVLAVTGGAVLELGAGSGRMAADLLAELDSLEKLPTAYFILERSADLRAQQQKRLACLPPRLARRPSWIDRLPERFDGIILANELLDALPVHLVVWREDGVFERGVVCRGEGGFAFEDRLLGEGELLREAYRLNPPAPYLSEICLFARGLVRTLAGTLKRGALLFIDYGFGEGEYYHPDRSRGTLMCHYRHRAHDDPFFLPGLQDITAHVDFSAIARAAVECGLDLLGYTTQAHFLINLGITDLLARTPAEATAAYLPMAAEAHKLTSPSEMGELFKVIALGRGVDALLSGFARGDLSRLL